ESNRSSRICNPVRNLSANPPPNQEFLRFSFFGAAMQDFLAEEIGTNFLHRHGCAFAAAAEAGHPAKMYWAGGQKPKENAQAGTISMQSCIEKVPILGGRAV
ncbi:hypothetical protein, partial [Paracoccus seriniphilus]|uniref:hypothetical protein n=1 Tax=Paracoccus seriniphilus TaxID=184748 RepID=UPI003566ABC8